MLNKNSVELYAILRRLSRQMHRFSHKVEHEQGLYHGQSKLLQLIAQKDGIVQRDIAELMDMRPSSVTEMLGKLEQLNLIFRKQDEKDQRLMHIYLTETGKETVERTVKSEENFTIAMFKDLNEDEIDKMLAITTKLCESLDMINSDEADDWGEKCCGHHHHHHHCEEERYHEHHHNHFD